MLNGDERAPAQVVTVTVDVVVVVVIVRAPVSPADAQDRSADPNDEQRYKPLIDEFNAKKGPVTIDLLQGDPGGVPQAPRRD